MQKKWYAERTDDDSVYFAATSEKEKHAEIIQEARDLISEKFQEQASFRIEIFNSEKILGKWNVAINTGKKKRKKEQGKPLHDCDCEWQAEAVHGGFFFSAPSGELGHFEVLQEAKDFLSQKVTEKTMFRIKLFFKGNIRDAWTIAVYPQDYEGQYIVCRGWIYKKDATRYLRMCTNVYKETSWNTPIEIIEYRVEFASNDLEKIIDYLERTNRTEDAERIKVLEGKSRKKDNGGET